MDSAALEDPCFSAWNKKEKEKENKNLKTCFIEKQLQMKPYSGDNHSLCSSMGSSTLSSDSNESIYLERINFIDDSYVVPFPSVDSSKGDLLRFSTSVSSEDFVNVSKGPKTSTVEETALLMLGNISRTGDQNSDSIFCRMEQLREFLENKLGTQLLVSAYNCVINIESKNDKDISKDISSILSENMGYFPIIVQLAHCEVKWYQQESFSSREL